MKKFILILPLIAFSISLIAEQKEDNLKFADLFCEDGYDSFCEERTELIIEERITKDEFGEEDINIHAYFINNGQEYRVKSIDYNCNLDKEVIFPFRIYATFPRNLDYSTDRNSMFFAHIIHRYKLQDGTVGSFYQNNVLDLYGFGGKLDRKELKEFWLGGGEENPLSLNLKSYRNVFKETGVHPRKLRRMGKLIVNIPIMGSDEVYTLSINPFHESWLELYDLQCQELDTSSASSFDF